MKSCTQRLVELATPRRKTTPTKVKRVITLKAQSRPFPSSDRQASQLAKTSDFAKAVLQRVLEGQLQLRRDLVPVVTTGANAEVGVAALLDEGRQPRTRLGEGGVNASQGAAAGRAPPYTLPTLQDIQAEQRIDQEVAMYVNTYSALLWGARAP